GTHVFGVTGNDDADGLHLVHRRVGRIEQAGIAVEANVALDGAAQIAFEIAHGENYTPRLYWAHARPASCPPAERVRRSRHGRHAVRARVFAPAARRIRHLRLAR